MASPNTDARIIIAGAGIAGLTLANMLEKFNINYLLLESHGEIAPPVGASIGLFPNGLRILDQIGCYEPLRAFITPCNFATRTEKGRLVIQSPDLTKVLEERHGYPVLFLDRQWLLQILYDQLEHKDRVLLNKSVSNIRPTTGGIEVTTQDGEEFHGTLIVGADGVHSTVRREMFRLGHKHEPSSFPENFENTIPCHYLCLFGIAQNVPGWATGDECSVLGKGASQLIVSGPDNRVYFFFFSKLPEPKYGDDIPRCTEEMEAEFVNKYADHPVTEVVRFGQIYDQRLTSTLTPLHEFVLEKWFFGRMMVFGDAAHKPNPIGGQGGNGAIESCADFVNALVRTKDNRTEGLDRLTDREITAIFQDTQSARYKKAKHVVDDSHTRQALSAYENPLKAFLFWEVMAPLLGQEAAVARLGATFLDATRVHKLPVVARPKKVQFKDEMPAKSLHGTAFDRTLILVGLGLLVVIVVVQIWRASHDVLEGTELRSGFRPWLRLVFRSVAES